MRVKINGPGGAEAGRVNDQAEAVGVRDFKQSGIFHSVFLFTVKRSGVNVRRTSSALFGHIFLTTMNPGTWPLRLIKISNNEIICLTVRA